MGKEGEERGGKRLRKGEGKEGEERGGRERGE